MPAEDTKHVFQWESSIFLFRVISNFRVVSLQTIDLFIVKLSNLSG